MTTKLVRVLVVMAASVSMEGNRSKGKINCLPKDVGSKTVYFLTDVRILSVIFHCFTVHFDSLSFIHTNSGTFSYNYVSVF